ncbi:MAG: transcription-repair coupling factor [Alphaproteobacteria bacterium]|nr:transcription-repair coupling factor [Alphaproteobacteria bacterium]
MKFLDKIDFAAGRKTIGGVPEGFDALVLAALALRQVGGVRPAAMLHVARDDARLARLEQGLAFFAPGLRIVSLPAWDCLPYDRVSPNGEVVSRRIGALSDLAGGGLAEAPAGPSVVLTTVNALLQRVPARASFEAAVFAVRVGEKLDTAAMFAFLARNGYRRAGTVREAGEYAQRGGIVDVFPPGTDEPMRLDLFGDVLEGIRAFDPMTQRSGERREALRLQPVSEVMVDAASIQRFRTGYRAAFGTNASDDPLYAAVTAGHRHPGMEHWLPLFAENLETLFDYLPRAPVSLDHGVGDAAAERQNQIAEFYRQRREIAASPGAAEGAPIYRPLPPDSLYVGAAELEGALGGRAVLELAPFAPPEGAGIDAGGRLGRDFAEARARPDGRLLDTVREHIAAEVEAGRRTVVAAYTLGARERLGTLLRSHGLAAQKPVEAWPEAEVLPPGTTALAVLPIERGFTAPGITVIGEQDILGERLARPSRRKKRADRIIGELSALSEGDFVVHVDHGIGQYDGLVALEVAGAPHDCLRVLYAGGDKLFVPVENLEVLSRYGSAESGAVLDRLGGAAWQARRARVKQRLKDMADELIRIAAERQVREGEVLEPPDGMYQEFCARFPWTETEDQERAIADTLEDLASGKPTDRLICGDVGFGKTEVALRAAFIAAMSGTQVAVVVPTTLLARQHYRAFTQRFAGLPLRLAQLSRLVAAKEASRIKAELADGRIDIVIGTHALLGKGIAFRNLGLLIVDEEQHFGVRQKERLKHLRADVHVLTLTATPIPRTLQLALSGVREMSLIATPPVDRLAVRTFVLPYDPVVIREAILREQHRGGQVFYVCPRIEDLPKLEQRLRRLVPEVKIAVAHGQMSGTELEKAMEGFYDGAFEVLLSTNIIESGLDIPTANTIIVHRADMFGLSQLYQLRGRVGRGKTRAYAYLTLPGEKAPTPAATRRLEVMQTLDTLGAGFTLASHDLDIRGAGNLLGEEQSGHIREVGIELYQQMLEEAVAEAKGAAAREPAAEWTPQIALDTPVLIPEAYVPDLDVRLALYRRIASLVDRQEIDAFAAELIDRFGPLPQEVENLLEIIAIKRLCRDAGVEKVEAGPKGALIAFRDNKFARPEKLVRYISRNAATTKIRPDQRVVFQRDWEEAPQRLKGLATLLGELKQLAA